MAKVWFTADWHVGHERIIELCNRPFASVEEMNAELLGRHNEVVAPEDTVWILGDAALGPLAESLPFLSRFHGRKILISGNHDRTFIGYNPDSRKRAEWVERYREQAGFSAVVTGRGYPKHPIRVPLLGQFPVVVSHFPESGESAAEREDRYAEYRPRRGRGKVPWLVHGHVHDAWCVQPESRQLNVGVDVWDFAPVPADVVTAMIGDAS